MERREREKRERKRGIMSTLLLHLGTILKANQSEIKNTIEGGREKEKKKERKRIELNSKYN